jgi:hypothetical protein
MAQSIDIKAVLAGLLVDHVFLPRQQIEQQRGVTPGLEHLGHGPVPPAEAAAAAAVRKHHQPSGVRRRRQVALEDGPSRHYLYGHWWNHLRPHTPVG